MNEERRTVQFLVERLCPNVYDERACSHYDQLFLMEPLAIWCYWPPEARSNFICAEAAHVFRVTEESINEVATRFDGTREWHACVCEHMGRVIE